MIRANDEALLVPPLASGQGSTQIEPSSPPRPSAGPALAPLAFASLWATGDDPVREGVFRVQALRRGADGRWEALARFCASAREGRTEPASARMVKDFGVTAADLAGAGAPAAALLELSSFLRGHAVITAGREPFLGWLGAAAGAPDPGLVVLGLSDLAALVLPGRLASEGEGLATELLGRSPERGPRAIEPEHLRAALGVLVARFLAQEEPELAVRCHVLRLAQQALEREGRSGASVIELVLQLLEQPSLWRDPARALEPEAADLCDGRLRAAVTALPGLHEALEHACPPWGHEQDEPEELLPARLEEERTLDSADARTVDEIFQEHLPRHFAALAGDGRASGYRAGQHEVAAAIAAGFGRRELRLVHAPTGTGKTLAYLVPTALWALRNRTRVGIATFTRILQEQAMEREMPLALSLLRSATDAHGIRVSVLKGRENYLCWRALCLQVPDGREPAEETLAWSALAGFALADASGDLDHFPLRSPLPELEPAAWKGALERLLRAARSQSGCCLFERDRRTCAAEAAWRRAMCSHLVLTNHALALARRDFFQHLVFDECEHLHDVALNAFSTSVSLRALGELFERLHALDGRRPLNRVLSLAPPGSEASLEARNCLRSLQDARRALGALARELVGFKHWRLERMRERSEADAHSLFREYVLEHEAGAALAGMHAGLATAMDELCANLARLAEFLDVALPAREVPRLRRALELLRSELEESRTGVEAWIPREGGEIRFGREAFHDLEVGAQEDDLLVVRVLLPQEYLGRRYYPTLAGAVLLSATTWLRGGFESAAAYLGLARAAEPAPEEEREPCLVNAFRAPEVFDYSRVLVCAPRDAPAVHDKQAFLGHTARFLAYLAERTRGRVLGLFTNAEDLARVGQQLAPFFATRRIPFWWQRMAGVSKEELGQLFRAQVDSVLLGLDTFWYGADFPGSTLEYLVIVRLPYGVPDRYHHAQCAVLGSAEQRRVIYLPRALSKFRQGFGRLMRKESDRGCVFVLDRRVLDPRHRAFLKELPLREELALRSGQPAAPLARLVAGDSDLCLSEAFKHMGMGADLERRGLKRPFAGWRMD